MMMLLLKEETEGVIHSLGEVSVVGTAVTDSNRKMCAPEDSGVWLTRLESTLYALFFVDVMTQERFNWIRTGFLFTSFIYFLVYERGEGSHSLVWCASEHSIPFEIEIVRPLSFNVKTISYKRFVPVVTPSNPKDLRPMLIAWWVREVAAPHVEIIKSNFSRDNFINHRQCTAQFLSYL